MDCSMPGRPVHRQFPEFTQTHVHWVNDAIQPSHPLLSPSPPDFNLSPYSNIHYQIHYYLYKQLAGLDNSTVYINRLFYAGHMLHLHLYLFHFKVSLLAQMVKNLPAIWETQVQSLGHEDPLEKGMAIHSSILAWRIPGTEEPGGLQSLGSQRVWHDWATNTFISTSAIAFSYFPS